MRILFAHLWSDDRGAVITIEFILFCVIVILGLVPAVAVVARQTTEGLVTFANMLLQIAERIELRVGGFEAEFTTSTGATFVASMTPFTIFTPLHGTTLQFDVVTTNANPKTFNAVTIDPAP